MSDGGEYEPAGHIPAATRADADVVIVGGGFAGLYAVHRIRELGLSVQAFEAAPDVGGTWYWNGYPGARCDVESVDYAYSFSPELQQEWTWTERYAAQPEILRYLNHVADRFDLRRDIQLDTTVLSARFDEQTDRWTVHTNRADEIVARYCIMAVGNLSAPNKPDIVGLDAFDGDSFHTSRWPKTSVDLTGKHVGVIGTGSTGIQLIPTIAKQAGHVYVFQRTPNFAVPAQNAPLSADKVEAIKADYPSRNQIARMAPSGSPVECHDRSIFSISDDEREAFFEEAWSQGGPRLVWGFNDLITNPAANDLVAEFVHRKIRERVKDPAVAERLLPRDHYLGTKRLCIDIDYFEAYNRPNVTLVDLRETPLTRATGTGLTTSERHYDLDCIVFATGFDAVTGALRAINIVGRGGTSLAEKWQDGPRAYLGLASAGFPNLFVVTGPGSPSVLSNMAISIEQHIDWITDAIAYMGAHEITTIEPDAAAEDRWIEHVAEVAGQTLCANAPSWYAGANISGKPRVFMPYMGGVGAYRVKCDEVVAAQYEGFLLAGGEGELVKGHPAVSSRPVRS